MTGTDLQEAFLKSLEEIKEESPVTALSPDTLERIAQIPGVHIG